MPLLVLLSNTYSRQKAHKMLGISNKDCLYLAAINWWCFLFPKESKTSTLKKTVKIKK
jgi:hypothetical protein